MRTNDFYALQRVLENVAHALTLVWDLVLLFEEIKDKLFDAKETLETAIDERVIFLVVKAN